MRLNWKENQESGFAAIGLAIILAVVLLMCINAIQTQMTTYFSDFRKTKMKLDAEILSENFATALKENYDRIAETPGMPTQNKLQYSSTDTLVGLIKSGTISLCVPFPKEFLDVSKNLRGDCVKLEPDKISEKILEKPFKYASLIFQLNSDLEVSTVDQIALFFNAFLSTVMIPNAVAQSGGTDLAMPDLTSSVLPLPISLSYKASDDDFNHKYFMRCKDGATAQPAFECITIMFCAKAGGNCDTAEIVRTTFAFFKPPSSSLED
jgi:hypothetical protein